MRHLQRFLVISYLYSFSTCHGFSQKIMSTKGTTQLLPKAIDRRAFAVSTLVAWPSAVGAIQEPRIVDVGGGFDLLEDRQLREKDVIYPISMEGVWICDRVVTQFDGDQFQAKEAWKALGGGTLTSNMVESFPTRYIRSPLIGDLGVVADRGFEFSRRASTTSVSWKVDEPDILMYDKIRLAVRKRVVEPPSEKGFGFNELIRIEDGPFTRVAEVKRRYRRGYDENGNRIVEGLEIMKTYRVLDGVAGTELPTSTVKSSIRLRRPPS